MRLARADGLPLPKESQLYSPHLGALGQMKAKQIINLAPVQFGWLYQVKSWLPGTSHYSIYIRKKL